ncbi:MAG: hypothetical protein HYX67_16445 [Candidatus Melainabacteria bacterium]|nr:hypothetical protein [Candidatus Melainabacteria bacterium]
MALDLLSEAMPQELGTVNMLVEAQLAKAIREPNDIVEIVESLEPIHDRESRSLPTIHNLDRVDAVFEIANIVLGMLPAAHAQAT